MRIMADPSKAYRRNDYEWLGQVDGEATPLLVGYQSRPIYMQRNVDVGILILGFLLIGGITIGTYLLIQEYRTFPINYPFDLVERNIWGADDDLPTGRKILNNTKLLNIYIFQTNDKQCFDLQECKKVVQNLQFESNKTLNFDIPYNFLIGGDGRTYEGRGWMYEHGYNDIFNLTNSLTIGLLGNFTINSPPSRQIEETKALISESLRRNKLSKDYQIYGVKNNSKHENDGEALFQKILIWKNWKRVISIL